MPVDPALVTLWVDAWARSRHAAPPVPRLGGLYVAVGDPGQVGRYVFPTFDPAIVTAAADAIDAPEIFLKILAEDEEVAPLLPPRWSFRPPGYMMAVDLAAMTKPAAPPSGYAATIREERGVRHIAIVAPDGTLAAQGRAIVMGELLVFDRIMTDPAHGRRGLGSVVMGTLARDGAVRGATRGLLVATPAGKALYATLGWTQVAPYTTAVIEPTV